MGLNRFVKVYNTTQLYEDFWTLIHNNDSHFLSDSVFKRPEICKSTRKHIQITFPFNQCKNLGRFDLLLTNICKMSISLYQRSLWRTMIEITDTLFPTFYISKSFNLSVWSHTGQPVVKQKSDLTCNRIIAQKSAIVCHCLFIKWPGTEQATSHKLD